MNNLRIKVLPAANSTSGSPVVVGTVKLSDWVGLYDVDQYDPESDKELGDPGEGYQRNEDPARVELYAKNLINNQSDTNTAIICNLRKFDTTNHLIEEDGNMYLILDKESKAWVCEGQTRSRAYEKLANDKELLSKFGDTPLIVIFYLNEEVDHEKLTFFNTNYFQKPVPVNNKQELQIGILKMKDSEIAAIALMREMRKNSSTWSDKIIKPNSKIGIIPSSGFTTSIKQHIATQAWFDMFSLEIKFLWLDAFWKAVENILPECFVEAEKYSLQKAVGVNVMHSIMPIVYEKIKNSGDKPEEVKSWEKHLGYLANHKSENRETPPKKVVGHEFWLAGKKGGAGRYSSAAGKAELIGIFKDAIKK